MKPLWQSREQAEDTAERLRKFGQPLRLMILSLLLQGEKSVSEIDMATGIGQPGLSQQLAELRRAELVTTRRQAKQVFYSIADESVELCVPSWWIVHVMSFWPSGPFGGGSNPPPPGPPG